MSSSFSPEEKERLIAALEKAKNNFVYSMEMLQSAVREDLTPVEKERLTRLIATYEHLSSRLVPAADNINLIRMERDL